MCINLDFILFLSQYIVIGITIIVVKHHGNQCFLFVDVHI